MNTQELIAAIRVRLDDSVTPTLVSTTTILEQLSLTQNEFARLTLSLFSESIVSVVAGQPWLSLPSEMVLVKTVVLGGVQLRSVTSGELDFGYYSINNTENTGRFSAWRAATGTPKFAVVDMHADKVRLVPTPTTNGSAIVEGYIIPPNVFYDGVLPTVNPQIPAAYHELLLAGALLRLYTLFDVEIFNPSKAQLYAAQWQQGLMEAQNLFQTPLRRQVRLMDLPRGFGFGSVLQAGTAGS